MMLRTVLLLLLCTSLGVCATLGYYQTDANEEAAARDAAGAAAPVEATEHPTSAETLPADEQGADGANPPLEALSKEAVTQEQPPAAAQDNEIRPVQINVSPKKAAAPEDANSWSLTSIRSSFQTVHGYFDSLVELVGGHKGVCQYRCRYGEESSYIYVIHVKSRPTGQIWSWVTFYLVPKVIS